MRLRTGHTPDAWDDQGPQQGRLTLMAYSSVHALNVGQMAPVVSAGKMPVTPIEAARRRRRSEAQKAERARNTPAEYPIMVMASVMTNPDNGAVEASITEVQP